MFIASLYHLAVAAGILVGAVLFAAVLGVGWVVWFGGDTRERRPGRTGPSRRS